MKRYPVDMHPAEPENTAEVPAVPAQGYEHTCWQCEKTVMSPYKESYSCECGCFGSRLSYTQGRGTSREATAEQLDFIARTPCP